MKIYSDILTGHDLRMAAQAAGADAGSRVGFHKDDTICRPRLRRRGWDILLSRADSNRPYNSGHCGATCERGAASRKDWGVFLAVLFERDPRLRAGFYDGRDMFHAVTNGVYEDISGWGERGSNHGTDIATDGACGRSWNDALGTSRTPAPSARCPYEGEHAQMGVSCG